MKEIRLGGKYSNHVMLVDDDIYDEMMRLGSWNFSPNGSGNIYARKGTCFAHRYAGVLYGILKTLNDPFQIDHINHNGLDNTRNNLRAVTRQENQRNRRKSLNCSSIYKGVYWHKGNKSWAVRLRGVKKRHLGHFHDEIVAAKVYDNAARKLGYLESTLNFSNCNGG